MNFHLKFFLRNFTDFTPSFLLVYHNHVYLQFCNSPVSFLKFFHRLHDILITQRAQTSLKRLQYFLKSSRGLTTRSDVVKTSGKRRLFYDVLKTSYLRRLEDVQFTTPWRRLIYDVFRTSIYDVLKTSDLRRLEDVQFTTSWKRL